MKSEEHQTLERMFKFGGSFAMHISQAARHADASNYDKLKKAFPCLWYTYGAQGVFAKIETEQL
jgi:hypothetical protein